IETLIATCGYSVAAGATEYCDESVVAVLIGAVPEGSATIFRRPAERPQGWLGIVHADPQVPALPELIGDFSEACGAYLVGGLVAARGPRPQWAGKLSEGGVSGIMFSDRKSTRLNSSHVKISYAIFCLKKKIKRKVLKK